MKTIYLKAFGVIAVALIVFSMVPLSNAQDQRQPYTMQFQLLNHPDGDQTYELNVTISQELYDYYSHYRGHGMFSEQDFAKFITPYTLKPIADRLLQIYNNTEDFTNGVLMLVHQITYNETIPCKYPVETLVDNKGDCDLFVFIAASILEAGGVNVVLLYYKTQQHMELGVQLPNAPADARTEVFSVKYQGVPYYIGECTGSKWRDGWRVGECPTDYRNVTAQIITMDYMEQTSIGQVSAALEELEPSTISMQVSSALTLQGMQITITGQVLPEAAEENVTLQAKINSPTWTTIGTVQTQNDGRFEYTWTPPDAGSVTVQAGWLGNKQLNGDKSVEQKVTVMPIYLVLLVATSAFTICLIVVAVVKLRRKTPQPQAYSAQYASASPPPEAPPPPPPEQPTTQPMEPLENKEPPDESV
jgi:hypothetical protein